MLTLIRTVALSALVGLGALAAMPAPAMAQSGGIYLGFGSSDRGPSAGFHFNDRGRHDYRDRGRHHQRDTRRQARERDHRGFCSPREAVRKASRMGLRNARVVSANHRVIRVEGRRHSPRHHIVTFANARNCPVLR